MSEEPTTSPLVTEPQSSVFAGAIPTNTPTVAETGVPVTAGKEGPGPSSGSLAGGHRRSQSSTSTPLGPGYGEAVPAYGGIGVPKYGLSDSGQPTRYESAEEEKQRLAQADREYLIQGTSSTQHGLDQAPSNAVSTSSSESQDEEKKRLEREERNRCANSRFVL